MEIAGAHHTGITVSDLDRSLAYYEGLLGFELLYRRLYEEEYILRIVNVPGATALDVAILRIPGGEHLIELLDYKGCERHPGSVRPSDYGTGHLCVRVTGIHEWAERLRAAGVRTRTDAPVEIAAGPNKGGFSIYTLDPDGFVVELHQRPPA